MSDFEVHPRGTAEEIRHLKDALIVAVEALEEYAKEGETLDWLKQQVEQLV
jgi:hypothetical protein